MESTRRSREMAVFVVLEKVPPLNNVQYISGKLFNSSINLTMSGREGICNCVTRKEWSDG